MFLYQGKNPDQFFSGHIHMDVPSIPRENNLGGVANKVTPCYHISTVLTISELYTVNSCKPEYYINFKFRMTAEKVHISAVQKHSSNMK
jgi:hypothetical protein